MKFPVNSTLYDTTNSHAYIEISHNNARSNTDGSSIAINYATGDTARCCNMHNAFLSVALSVISDW